MRTLSRIVIGLLLSLSLLVASGCVSTDRSDLEQEIRELKGRPGGRIKPLPEIKPYEPYTYQSSGLGARDPFNAFYQLRYEDVAEVKKDTGLSREMENEIRNRNREELEQFELDGLRMVGIMQNEGNNWGIIMDPDGAVHRVSVGNYLGRNVGKIVNIFEDRIELREIIQNRQGRWEERQAAIGLVE